MKTNFDSKLVFYIVFALMLVTKGFLLGFKKRAFIENSKVEIFIQPLLSIAFFFAMISAPLNSDSYVFNLLFISGLALYSVISVFYLLNKKYVSFYGVSKKIILEEISNILVEKEIEFTLVNKGIIKEVKKIYLNEKDICIKITDDQGLKYHNKIRFINFKDEGLLKEIKEKLSDLGKVHTSKQAMASGVSNLIMGILLLGMSIWMMFL